MTRNHRIDVINMIEAAQAAWEGADWAHYPPGDSDDYSDGLVLCYGDVVGCKTCAKAESSAARAANYGYGAIDALQRNDVTSAIAALERAAAEEREWGDDVFWGPVLLALKATIAPAKGAEREGKA